MFPIRYNVGRKFLLLSLSHLLFRRGQWNSTPVLLRGKSHGWRRLVGCSSWGRWELDTTQWLHFHFSLSYMEKEMATHSSVLAWRIPGIGEPGGLPSMGSHRVGHDWSDLAAAAAAAAGAFNCQVFLISLWSMTVSPFFFFFYELFEEYSPDIPHSVLSAEVLLCFSHD